MNSNQIKITFLGTGTSTGVPVVGCSCNVCISENPKNKRMRSSILITIQGKFNILIDTTPDLRSQLLREKINHIDACILTHEHADHLHGIDDLRPLTYFQNKIIPIYTNQKLITHLKEKFSYIFDRANSYPKGEILGGGIPKLELFGIDLDNPLDLCGEKFKFFVLPHGYGETLGVVHDKFAYLIDCHQIPEQVIKYCVEKKLNTLIIDCVRRKPHKTHLSLDQTIKYINSIKAKNNFLTHLSDQFEHEELGQELLTYKDYPKMAPSFDGQVILI